MTERIGEFLDPKNIKWCDGTRRYLEPYLEGNEMKIMNFSGPGNSTCARYLLENPPITHINGVRFKGDEAALFHDLRYGEALEEPDENARRALMRYADEIFINERRKEYERTGLGLAGLRGIMGKVWIEDTSPATARQIFGRYSSI